MQQNKDTKLSAEIELISADKKELASALSTVIDKFKVKRHLAIFDFLKSKGNALSSLLHILIILPFLGVLSIRDLIKSGMSCKEIDCQKDAFYDAKNNEQINWRKLLMLHVKRFTFLMRNNINTETYKPTALIFDDSVLEKAGKKFEKCGMVHDHTKNVHVLGYKILVCGFWDGESFIPVDFSLHREKGNSHIKLVSTCKKADKAKTKAKEQLNRATSVQEGKNNNMQKYKLIWQNHKTKTNEKRYTKSVEAFQKATDKVKKAKTELELAENAQNKANKELRRFYKKGRLYGLNAKERTSQHKKNVKTSSCGFFRRKEADKSKIKCMLDMLGRCVKNGIVPDYVLVDSWFFCFDLLLKLKLLKKDSIKLVSMVKIHNQNFTLCENNKLQSVKAILKTKERKAKTCKKHKAKYIKVSCLYNDIRVNLFYIKMGHSGKWHLLATTDLSLNFIRLIEIYQIRWSIEIFFKESKQYLNLGGCQSWNFDAQIADATIIMIQYVMLEYYKRLNHQNSIGGLFKGLQKELIEIDLVTRLLTILQKLVELLCECAGIDLLTFQEQAMKDDGILGKFIELYPSSPLKRSA